MTMMLALPNLNVKSATRSFISCLCGNLVSLMIYLYLLIEIPKDTKKYKSEKSPLPKYLRVLGISAYQLSMTDAEKRCFL